MRAYSPPMPLFMMTLIVGAYLLGSVSFALLIAKSRGINLREVGSGNLGATNVGRALGKKTGRLVLVLDALKGLLPTLATRVVFGEEPIVGMVAVAAVVGHVFPIWHGFRGGKGAATSLGVVLVVSPLAGALAAVTYVAGKKLTRRASVGSLAGSVVATITTYIQSMYTPTHTSWQAVTALTLLALVAVAHRSNIARLANGTEPES